VFSYKSWVWALSPFFQVQKMNNLRRKRSLSSRKLKDYWSKLIFFSTAAVCDFVTSPFVTCISKVNLLQGFHVAIYRKLLWKILELVLWIIWEFLGLILCRETSVLKFHIVLLFLLSLCIIHKMVYWYFDVTSVCYFYDIGVA